jgi:hypothetical protein
LPLLLLLLSRRRAGAAAVGVAPVAARAARNGLEHHSALVRLRYSNAIALRVRDQLRVGNSIQRHAKRIAARGVKVRRFHVLRLGGRGVHRRRRCHVRGVKRSSAAMVRSSDGHRVVFMRRGGLVRVLR